MTNIWILGATGYVGRALTQYLLDIRPENTVISTLAHRTLPFRSLENTNLITGCLENFDFGWFDRFPPDVIFHCARLAGNTDNARKRAAKRGKHANLRWRRTLCELPKTPTVIYCSGTLMYGNQSSIIDEDTIINPVAYAQYYAAAETPWMSPPADKEDIRIVRPAWIMGPDSWFYYFFYRPAIETGKVPYYGDGQQQMSLLHVDDCGGLLYHSWIEGEINQHYNLFVFPPVSQQQFSEMVAHEMNCEVECINASQLEQKHGTTVMEALTSNIPVETKHRKWYGKYNPRYGDLKEMINMVIRDCKH
jgi:nucleoside-diphosphate-sugar epimerase